MGYREKVTTCHTWECDLCGAVVAECDEPPRVILDGWHLYRDRGGETYCCERCHAHALHMRRVWRFIDATEE